MTEVHPGVFAVCLPQLPGDYRLRFGFSDGSVWERRDPYRFGPTWGELDLWLFNQGRHHALYQKLGAHLLVLEGIPGVAFAVWAPGARRVSVVGDFCRWDGRLFPMRQLGTSGVWEIFIPDLVEGSPYKFEIKTHQGHLRLKADPVGFRFELRPRNASLVWGSAHRWGDQAWMETRSKRAPLREPMAIYEVHLGSWRRSPEGRWLSWREVTPRLIKHLQRCNFNWLELLPVMEHPLDESWGYQITGYFAPTSRYGDPDGLKFLIDRCHQEGIGVILDWVPSHFPKDDWALRRFTGEYLFEHPNPKRSDHPDWGSLVFDYGRPEVRNFLIANALWWLEEYHADGLRVDAVASMLYLDYSRTDWEPNVYGGREHLEAIDFLRELNEVIHARMPGTLTVAEESTAWPGVTRSVHLGGLGFDLKWSMGWMHDALSYFSRDPIHRKWHHHELTFSMLYAYQERFLLPLSHDEVVHGKGSLLRKMAGDRWQRMANLRALLGHLFAHPGKKLLFMGSEIAQEREWDHRSQVDWHLLQEPDHQGVYRYVRDLGGIYQREPSLWELDHDPQGFRWIDCHDADQSVYSFCRFGRSEHLVCMLNLTPVPRFGYRIGVPVRAFYGEILNSDSTFYGGSNLGNLGGVHSEPVPWHGYPCSLSLTLPPLSCLYLKPLPG